MREAAVRGPIRGRRRAVLIRKKTTNTTGQHEGRGAVDATAAKPPPSHLARQQTRHAAVAWMAKRVPAAQSMGAPTLIYRSTAVTTIKALTPAGCEALTHRECGTEEPFCRRFRATRPPLTQTWHCEHTPWWGLVATARSVAEHTAPRCVLIDEPDGLPPEPDGDHADVEPYGLRKKPTASERRLMPIKRRI